MGAFAQSNMGVFTVHMMTLSKYQALYFLIRLLDVLAVLDNPSPYMAK